MLTVLSPRRRNKGGVCEHLLSPQVLPSPTQMTAAVWLEYVPKVYVIWLLFLSAIVWGGGVWWEVVGSWMQNTMNG